MKQCLIIAERKKPPMSDAEPEEDDREAASGDGPERTIKADELFAGKREVWIDLDGVRYRLRITRRGKLILQK